MPNICELCTSSECSGPFSQNQCSWEHIGQVEKPKPSWKKERDMRHVDNLSHLTGYYKGNFYSEGIVRK